MKKYLKYQGNFCDKDCLGINTMVVVNLNNLSNHC